MNLKETAEAASCLLGLEIGQNRRHNPKTYVRFDNEWAGSAFQFMDNIENDEAVLKESLDGAHQVRSLVARRRDRLELELQKEEKQLQQLEDQLKKQQRKIRASASQRRRSPSPNPLRGSSSEILLPVISPKQNHTDNRTRKEAGRAQQFDHQPGHEKYLEAKQSHKHAQADMALTEKRMTTKTLAVEVHHKPSSKHRKARRKKLMQSCRINTNHKIDPHLQSYIDELKSPIEDLESSNLLSPLSELFKENVKRIPSKDLCNDQVGVSWYLEPTRIRRK